MKKRAFLAVCLALALLLMYLPAGIADGLDGADDLGGLVLPIVEEPLTLTYWVDASGSLLSITDYSEMALYKKAEETGITIEFQHPPAGQGVEQFNLMMASQEFTDLISTNWSNIAGGPAKQIEDEAIITINDYLQYAPNFSRLLDQEPDLVKQLSTDDGSLYCFPWVNLYDETRVYMGFVVRQDWLEGLDIEQPETLEDWENMLTAFRDNDPNGNGEKDEIPYATNQKLTGLYRFLYTWDICPEWYVDGTEVKYGALQPEYREWLELMCKWYVEGLIDPDYANSDATIFDAMVTNSNVGSFYGYVGSGIGKFMTLMDGSDTGFNLNGVTYPVINEGDQPARGHRINYYNGTAVAISTSCKYVEEAVKYLDYDYSDRGYILNCFGIEGESFTYVDGEPVYTDLIVNNPEGKVFSDIMYTFNCFAGAFPGIHSPAAQMQYLALDVQREAIASWATTKHSIDMPLITPSSNEATRLASIMNEISTYQSETANKIIMGQADISEYDAFAAQLENMGINEAIDIQQRALDNYNAR